jgi:hypothetical protein
MQKEIGFTFDAGGDKERSALKIPRFGLGYYFCEGV